MQSFDTAFYLAKYEDVKQAIANGEIDTAEQHYTLFGISEGRDPNTAFDTSYYLNIYDDVRSANVNPLEHYETFGSNEGRDPSNIFDSSYYADNNPDVATSGLSPLQHFLTIGAKEGRKPSANFDEAGYLAANADVKAAVDAGQITAAEHYVLFGGSEGRTADGSALPTSGVVVDGYISGATGFIDVDGDGVQGPNDIPIVTDAQGNFQNPTGAAGTVIVSGGTDISTGLPFEGTLKAPSGSSTVTPLTNLIVEISSATGRTAEEAETKLKQSLNIPDGANLKTFDPLNVINNDNASDEEKSLALSIHSTAVKVANLAKIAASASEGATTRSTTDASDDAFAALALTIGGSDDGALVNISDENTIESIIQGTLRTSADQVNVGRDQDDFFTFDDALFQNLTDSAARVASQNNDRIDDILTNNASVDALLASVSQVQTVAQGNAAEALQNGASSGDTDFTDILDMFTGNGLVQQIINADIGDLDGDGQIDTISNPITDFFDDVDGGDFDFTDAGGNGGAPVIPTPGGGGGGGGSAPPQNNATFIVTLDSGQITYDGTATGPITAFFDGVNVSFTRGGVTAALAPAIADIGNDGVPAVPGILFSANVVGGLAQAGFLSKFEDGAIILQDTAQNLGDLSAAYAPAAAKIGSVVASDLNPVKIASLDYLTIGSAKFSDLDIIDLELSSSTDLSGQTLDTVDRLTLTNSNPNVQTQATLSPDQFKVLVGNITKRTDDLIAINVKEDTNLVSDILGNPFDFSDVDFLRVNNDNAGLSIAVTISAAQLTAVGTGLQKSPDERVIIGVETTTDLTNADLSNADAIRVDNTDNNIAVTGTISAQQLTAFAGNLSTSIDDQLVVDVKTDKNFTQDDISGVTGLNVDDGVDNNPIVATLTADQYNAVGDNLTKGNSDRVNVNVTTDSDLSSVDVSGIDQLTIDDSNNSNAITATLTPAQVTALNGKIVTGTDDLVEIRIGQTADLSNVSLAGANAILVDDKDNANSITGTLSLTQFDSFTGNISAGTDDQVVINVDSDRDFSNANFAGITGLVVDDDDDENDIAATLGITQFNAVAGNLSVGGEDSIILNITADTDLSALDLSNVGQLNIDDSNNSNAITATLTQAQISALGANITKGADDRIAVRIDQTADLTGTDLSAADTLVVDDQDNNNQITASISRDQFNALSGNISRGADDRVSLKLTKEADGQNLYQQDLSDINHLELNKAGGDILNDITADITDQQFLALNGAISIVGTGSEVRIHMTQNADFTQSDLSIAPRIILSSFFLPNADVEVRLTAEQFARYGNNITNADAQDTVIVVASSSANFVTDEPYVTNFPYDDIGQLVVDDGTNNGITITLNGNIFFQEGLDTKTVKGLNEQIILDYDSGPQNLTSRDLSLIDGLNLRDAETVTLTNSQFASLSSITKAGNVTVVVNVTQTVDFSESDLSAVNQLVIDDSANTAITALVSRAQFAALADNVSTGTNDLYGIRVRSNVDLSATDLSAASTLSVDDGDNNAVARATISLAQFDALTGALSSQGNDQLNVTVTETRDFTAANLSGVTHLAIDDGDDANVIRATITAAQAAVIQGNVTKGADDLLAVRFTTTTDLSAADLSQFDEVVVDDGDNSNVITASLSVSLVNSLGNAITKGADDLISVTVAQDTDISGFDLATANAINVDDGTAASVTATVSQAQLTSFAGNISKGANDQVRVAITSTTDLSSTDLSGVDALIVDDNNNSNPITVTLTAAQVNDLAGNITKGADDLLSVSVTATTDLSSLDLTSANALTIDDSDTNTPITATLSSSQFTAFGSNIAKGAGDLLSLSITQETDLTSTNLSQVNALIVEDGDDNNPVGATLSLSQLSALSGSLTRGADDIVYVSVTGSASFITNSFASDGRLDGANGLRVDDGNNSNAITVVISAETANAVAGNVIRGSDDIIIVDDNEDDFDNTTIDGANILRIGAGAANWANANDTSTGGADTLIGFITSDNDGDVSNDTVNGINEWTYDSASDVLTYYDAVKSGASSVTLTGVNTISVQDSTSQSFTNGAEFVLGY